VVIRPIGDELLGRAEARRVEADRFEQVAEPFAEAVVVIDHEHGSAG
jgi:hypothetical protein